MANKEVVRILVDNGLKVTPQRISILEVIMGLDFHPSAENIVAYIRISHPNISMATIYNTLNTLTAKGVLQKVFTDNDSLRYDHIKEDHHHLYFSDSGAIEDYYDEELTGILRNYFKKKAIPDFRIESFKLQITGKPEVPAKLPKK